MTLSLNAHALPERVSCRAMACRGEVLISLEIEVGGLALKCLASGATEADLARVAVDVLEALGGQPLTPEMRTAIGLHCSGAIERCWTGETIEEEQARELDEALGDATPVAVLRLPD